MRRWTALLLAVEECDPAHEDSPGSQEIEQRVAELEKNNTELKAQAARLTRKTLSPYVSALLAKNGATESERVEASVVDKTLQTLSVEQRIAVKAEMARAGMID
jgi:hypothetical protein